LRAFKSLYLYGKDSLSRSRRFDDLVDKGRKFYLYENSWEEILEEVEYPSLFSGPLPGVRILNSKEERLPKKSREALEQALKRGIVVMSEYEGKSELKNFLKNASCRMEYYRLPYEMERANMVREEMKKSGKTINENALLLFIKLVGEDTLNLWGEIEKLKNLPISRITTDVIRTLAVPMREYPVWELEIAIANRNIIKAGEVLESLKVKGEQPAMVVGSLNYIISKICRRDLTKEIFGLDWKIKTGYSPWETLHLFLIKLTQVC